MDIPVFAITNVALPCLAVLFAAAVYLTTRTIAPGRIWLIAVITWLYVLVALFIMTSAVALRVGAEILGIVNASG